MVRLLVFVGVAFGWSWAWWLPLAVAGSTVGFGQFAPAYVAGVPGPLVAAVVVTAVTGGRPALRDLLVRMFRVRVPVRWYAAAFGLPVAMLGLALVVVPVSELGLFGVAPGLPATSVLVLFLYQVLVNGLGEETGWRGFALPVLRRRFAPLAATAVVSLVWAAWHLPLLGVLGSFEVMSRPVMLPAFWFGMFCMSVVLTWLYENGGASVFLAALWHGTYNVVAGTAASQGGVNVVFTVLLMAWAAAIVGYGGWRRFRARAAVPGA